MIRHISIRPVLNGFIVQVGCQELAYTSITNLCGNLHDYLVSPEGALKRMLPTLINRKHTHAHDPDFTHPPVPIPATPYPETAACGATACGPLPDRWGGSRAPYPMPDEAVAPGSVAPPAPEPRFSVGNSVIKARGDYRYTGIVVGVIRKLSLEVRYVVENADGQLHIFNENQLQHSAETATATATSNA